MNLPDHITRQQITDAFALLGLDAGEIMAFRGTRSHYCTWLELELRPRDMPATVEYVVVKIPILEREPEPDLVELARQEARG